MKNFLLSFSMSLLATVAFAQPGDYTLAPNFAYETLKGDTFDLYKTLDSGKTVIIDAMATWCPPCWSWHEGNYFKNLHEQYGPNGTDELRVIMIEADESTAADLLTRTINTGVRATTSLGDWTEGIEYPIMNADAFNSLYRISAFPTIIAITPNRMVYDIGRSTNLQTYQQWHLDSPGLATDETNAVMLNYSGSRTRCESRATGNVIVQNHSTSPLAEMTVRAMNGTEVFAEEVVDGPFDPYEPVSVRFRNMQAPDDQGWGINLRFEVLVDGDVNPDDNSSVKVPVWPLARTTKVTLEHTTDFYSVETGLVVTDADDNEVLNVAYAGAASGGGADANQTFDYPFDVTNDELECWTFTVSDAFGDGSDVYGTGLPEPGIVLYDENDNVIFETSFVSSPFTNSSAASVKLSSAVSSSEEAAVAEGINLYPNPATAGNVVVVELDELRTEQDELDVRIFNAQGQTVAAFTTNINGKQLSFDLPDVAAGVHFLELRSADASSVVRFTVD